MRWLLGLLIIAAMVVAGLVGVSFAGLDPFGRTRLTDVVPLGGMVPIRIAGDRLVVPSDLVRFDDQRRPGDHVRVDLAVLWPSMEGAEGPNDPRFDQVGPNAPVVFLGIEARDSDYDTTSRVATVYGRYFEGAPFDGPSGLQGRSMAAGSGYDDEIVLFEPGVVRPFAARCFALPDSTGEGEQPTRVCLRELLVGSQLIATYRIREAWLADWRRIDETMRVLVESFIVR